MIKKFLIGLICLLMIFLQGCKSSKQIDVASLAETVTINQTSDGLSYTFYIIDSGNAKNPVSIKANSLSDAVQKAKMSYIPNLSMSKLELLLINENAYLQVMRSDIAFVSSRYDISPLLYVSLCDDGTMKFFSKNKEGLKTIEDHIMLLKNKNDKVKTNSLSIYNSFAGDNKREFYVSYINSKNELKAEPYSIS